MKYPPRALLALAALLIVALIAACGGDDDSSTPAHACDGLPNGLSGTTLCQSTTGQGPVGSFIVTGAYDVQVVGGNIGSSNTAIRVYQIEPVGQGFSTTLVGTTGPKALVDGIQVRPGENVNVNFDFGPGEFFLIVDTDESNSWTAIVSPVDSIPS